ncbi:MAG: cobalamin-independent methionine synthase II family protein [Candidatus Binatia bacterium]
MQRSTAERILTTLTGSLPRPEDLAAMHVARADGHQIDEAAFQARIRSAVVDAVAHQVDLGIDVVSDGELSKNGYIDYTRERIAGFSGKMNASGAFYFTDLEPVPELVEWGYKDIHMAIPTCDGPLRYIGESQVQRDIGNFKAALQRHPATEAFIPAASPGVVAMCSPNTYYGSYDEYLLALAAALNAEYRAIAEAGFVLQVDAPDLALGADFHTWMWPEIERRSFETISQLHVEAINVALQGVPRERARMHLCWANYFGPHRKDYPLREVLKAAFRANVGGISFEAANPAHAHEWELFEDTAVPEGMTLIPGVIDTKTHVVEHPHAVAHRVRQWSQVVGAENVIAGTDCGFGTFVGLGTVHPKVTWWKLQALAEGAALASKPHSSRPGAART